MAQEITIFTFKYIPFKEWAKGFDSPTVDTLLKGKELTPLHHGVNKHDPQSVVELHQSEDGVAKICLMLQSIQ